MILLYSFTFLKSSHLCNVFLFFYKYCCIYEKIFYNIKYNYFIEGDFDMNDKEISGIIQRIKNRRLDLGLSYQDMQDLTGISKSTWQRYETGFIKNLAIDKLDIVANALKTTSGYLMGWEDQKVNEKPFTTVEEATAYLIKLPSMAAYGGYDLSKMSSREIIDFANELLHQFELISHKYKK